MAAGALQEWTAANGGAVLPPCVVLVYYLYGFSVLVSGCASYISTLTLSDFR
jgi:hypothetical protein